MKIVKKLRAILVPCKHHDIYEVRENGVVIGKIGISRSSKERGHGHIPDDLFITRPQTMELAQCSLSRSDYCNIRKQQCSQ